MTKTLKPKAERVAAFVAQGKTHIEAEIAVAREDSKAQIRRLKKRQREQDSKIDREVVELLKGEHADLYATLRSRAAEQLGARAKSKAQVATGEHDSEADGGHDATPESTPPSPRQWGGIGEDYPS